MLINETFSTQSLEFIADLANRGDIKQAKQALSSLMEKTPKDPEAWYLASFLVDQEDRKVQMLNKALNFDPNFAKAAQRLNKLTNPAEFASFFAVAPVLPLPTEPPAPAVEIIPALAQSNAYSRTDSPQRRGLSSLLLGVLTLAVLVAAVGSIMTASSVNNLYNRVALQATVITPLPTPTLHLIVTPQSQEVKWAYLTLQYAQIADVLDFNATVKRYAASVTLSDSVLQETLFSGLNQCWKNMEGSGLSGLTTDEARQCFKINNQDLSHVLSSLGANGWDLVSLINQSNQSEYAVEVVLKKQL